MPKYALKPNKVSVYCSKSTSGLSHLVEGSASRRHAKIDSQRRRDASADGGPEEIRKVAGGRGPNGRFWFSLGAINASICPVW